jgi:YD repeat-containing protein
MLVEEVVRANRQKVQVAGQSNPTTFVTRWSYNASNQPTFVETPEGDTAHYEYNQGAVAGMSGAYSRRVGLLQKATTRPGPRGGSGPSGQEQDELTVINCYEPLFNQVCATIETRGNPISGTSTFFTPQNGRTTPTVAISTASSRSRTCTTAPTRS